MGGSSFNSSTKKYKKYSQNGERCLFKGFGRSLFSKPSKSSQTIGKSFSKLDAKWSYGAPISRVITPVTHLNPTYNDPRGPVSCTLFKLQQNIHPSCPSHHSLGSDFRRGMILDGKRYNSWAYWAMIPVCGTSEWQIHFGPHGKSKGIHLPPNVSPFSRFPRNSRGPLWRDYENPPSYCWWLKSCTTWDV